MNKKILVRIDKYDPTIYHFYLDDSENGLYLGTLDLFDIDNGDIEEECNKNGIAYVKIQLDKKKE